MPTFELEATSKRFDLSRFATTMFSVDGLPSKTKSIAYRRVEKPTAILSARKVRTFLIEDSATSSIQTGATPPGISLNKCIELVRGFYRRRTEIEPSPAQLVRLSSEAGFAHQPQWSTHTDLWENSSPETLECASEILREVNGGNWSDDLSDNESCGAFRTALEEGYAVGVLTKILANLNEKESDVVRFALLQFLGHTPFELVNSTPELVRFVVDSLAHGQVSQRYEAAATFDYWCEIGFLELLQTAYDREENPEVKSRLFSTVRNTRSLNP